MLPTRPAKLELEGLFGIVAHVELFAACRQRLYPSPCGACNFHSVVARAIQKFLYHLAVTAIIRLSDLKNITMKSILSRVIYRKLKLQND
jgi:hypothetical protein